MTLKEFNDLYLGKAVHCKTEEMANKFLKLADSVGYRWFTGHKLTRFNEWGAHRENTYYTIFLDSIIYGNVNKNEKELPIVEFKGRQK